MARPRKNSREKSPRSRKLLFADTSYWAALLAVRDQYHPAALRWKNWVDDQSAWVVTTEAILWELLNMLAAPARRMHALEVYRQSQIGDGVEVIPYETEQIEAAVELYASRKDKGWSLTDCLSFVEMRSLHVTDALTADHHFRQAGFHALLLRDPPA